MVAAVALWPASSRPYIGGSQNNSIWNLLFGYNGFGRLSGNEAGSVGGGGPVGSRWGVTGLTRLFGSDMGTQSSWLLPAALIVGAGAVMLTWRAGRRSRTLVALGLWGSWLLVTAAVFSFGRGIIHPYYTVALAPAIGAVVGIGGAALWRRRSQLAARCWMAATVGVTAVWSSILLARTPSWHPMLRGLVLGGGLAVAVVLVAAPHLRGRVGVAIASTAMAVCLSAPGAYSLSTAATAHTGAIPSAGPASTGPGFGPGRGFRPGGFGGGGPGGLLDTSTPSASLVAALESGSGGYAWVAATPQAEQAAGYQLATGRPVMAIGGFNGTDPAPTLAQFERLVRADKVHWFIAGGGFGGFGGGGGEIASWVESHFSSRTVDGVTLYDLSANQG